MMTDPIADLLTRMRNALRVRADQCVVPGSSMKVRILDVLKREGYVNGYEVQSDGPRSAIVVHLKYGPDGQDVVRSLRRVSTPGCRRYRSAAKMPRIRGGFGIVVVSTDQGVMSDRECRERKLGGEILCAVE